LTRSSAQPCGARRPARRGDRALAAGQQELAAQAFDLERASIRRISGPRSGRAERAACRRSAAARGRQNAQQERQYSRAAQDYTQALTLDPKNAQARTGLARRPPPPATTVTPRRPARASRHSVRDASMKRAPLSGERAACRANGAEALEGLRRVDAASGERGFAAMRARAEGLEAQERWDEALQPTTRCCVRIARSSLPRRARPGLRRTCSSRIPAGADRSPRPAVLAAGSR